MPVPPNPLHVLIADDEPMLRSVIAEFLETLDGWTFAEAGDGAGALEYLRTHHVDCFLSDSRMPQMDLDDLLTITHREFPQTIVIATSGYSDIESSCRLLERGAHEFLSKPLNLDLLEQSLLWLPRRRQALELACEFFGGPQLDMALNHDRPFDLLSEALLSAPDPFRQRMRHARRTARLAERLVESLDPAAVNELILAALLHEVGSASQEIHLEAQAGSPSGKGSRFVRAHGLVGARLLDHYLPDRPTGSIVRNHVFELERGALGTASRESEAELPTLLATLNEIDDILFASAPSLKPDAEDLFGELESLCGKSRLPSPLRPLMDAWPEVLADYRNPGDD